MSSSSPIASAAMLNCSTATSKRLDSCACTTDVSTAIVLRPSFPHQPHSRNAVGTIPDPDRPSDQIVTGTKKGPILYDPLFLEPLSCLPAPLSAPAVLRRD